MHTDIACNCIAHWNIGCVLLPKIRGCIDSILSQRLVHLVNMLSMIPVNGVHSILIDKLSRHSLGFLKIGFESTLYEILSFFLHAIIRWVAATFCVTLSYTFVACSFICLQENSSWVARIFLQAYRNIFQLIFFLYQSNTTHLSSTWDHSPKLVFGWGNGGGDI